MTYAVMDASVTLAANRRASVFFDRQGSRRSVLRYAAIAECGTPGRQAILAPKEGLARLQALLAGSSKRLPCLGSALRLGGELPKEEHEKIDLPGDRGACGGAGGRTRVGITGEVHCAFALEPLDAQPRRGIVVSGGGEEPRGGLEPLGDPVAKDLLRPPSECNEIGRA